MTKPIFSIEFENPSEAIVKKLEEIKKLIKEESKKADKPAGRWKPEDGEFYFSVDSGSTHEYKWFSRPWEEDLYTAGLIFKTEQEAQVWIDRQKAITKVNDRIDELNGGWVADWNETYQQKHSVLYDHRASTFITPYTVRFECHNYLHPLYSEGAVMQIIKELEPELKLIFGIK